MFVVIEGIDAAGKATQATRLTERVPGARLFSFPAYHTPAGHLIKGHLHSVWHASSVVVSAEHTAADENKLDALVFQALQLTNRMEMAPHIIEAQQAGAFIVADRYWPSGVVYGRADGLDPDWLIHIHKALPQPDLFLLLHIDPKLSAERRPIRRDRYELQTGLMERAAFHYLDLWNANGSKDPQRWVVLGGDAPADEVSERVWQAVERRKRELAGG